MNEQVKIKIDDIFIFKGQLIDGTSFNSSEIKSWKVVSFFPKLNTKICDLQTLKMLEWSKKYPQVKFISISMDQIDVAKQWCQAHNVSNLFFVSDFKDKDFANKTNLYVDKKTMLKRGLILINEHNKIVALTINDDYANEPNYDIITQALLKY